MQYSKTIIHFTKKDQKTLSYNINIFLSYLLKFKITLVLHLSKLIIILKIHIKCIKHKDRDENHTFYVFYVEYNILCLPCKQLEMLCQLMEVLNNLNQVKSLQHKPVYIQPQLCC